MPVERVASVEPATYGSVLFERFVQGVGRMPEEGPVLDLGPTSSENLMFWVDRSRPVTAVDAVGRHRAGKELGIDDAGFAGILCWNVLCRLPRGAARELATRLVEVLLPGGYLFAIFDGDGRREPPSLRYRIAGEGRLRYEPVAAPQSPRPVPTKEIEAYLAPLKPRQMMVMRHGSREALGQSPPPPATPFPDARGVLAR